MASTSQVILQILASQRFAAFRRLLSYIVMLKLIILNCNLQAQVRSSSGGRLVNLRAEQSTEWLWFALWGIQRNVQKRAIDY